MSTAKTVKKTLIKIEFGLTALLLFVILLTALVVYVPWYVTSVRNNESIVSQLNTEIVKAVSSNISTLFENSQNSLVNLRDMFRQGIVDIEDPKDREALFLTMVRNSPDLSWIVYGWPNGNFFGVQREIIKNIENIYMVDREWVSDEARATKLVRSFAADGSLKSSETTPNENFKSTTRSWYTAGVGKEKPEWTDVYMFSTTRQPGINVSLPLVLENQPRGVISIALELNNISHFLRRLNAGKSGQIFVMNQKQDLLAFKDESEELFKVKDDSSLVLKKLSDSENQFLRVAASHVAESARIGDSNFSAGMKLITDPLTKNRFYVTVSALNLNQNLKLPGWVVGTVIPEEDFLGEIKENTRNLIIFLAILFAVNLVVILLISKRLIVKPIIEISKQTNEIRNFDLEKIMPVYTHFREINMLSESITNMSKGLMSFKKYVPTALVKNLIQQGIEIKLGGEERKLSIFFSDIAGFTSIFEKLGNKMIPHLGEYLSSMSRIIESNNGTIDKYIGDAIMAFWGAPTPSDKHAVEACRAALEYQNALRGLRLEWARDGKPELSSRIGINTGTVLVGNIGYEDRFGYTVIGDSVNVASRLESLGKEYGTEIIIGEATFTEARTEIFARRLDRVRVYGATIGIDIYELLAMKDTHGGSYQWIIQYENGLKLYAEAKWDAACEKFREVIAARGADAPSELMIARCEQFKLDPPLNWDGTIAMDHK